MQGHRFSFAAKAALLTLIVAWADPLFGMPVDFTTTGTFFCGSAVGCSTANQGSTLNVTNHGNTVTITATGFANMNIFPADVQVDADESPFDDVNVITFHTTSTSHGAPAAGVNTAGVTFTLNINQTSPLGAPNSGIFSGFFSGSIDARGSNTIVSFDPNATSLTLAGNITYRLNFLNADQTFWTIPNSGIGEAGITTETANVTPEPTFIFLTGLGFIGISLVSHRRRRRFLS